jgi:hypothetical protein
MGFTLKLKCFLKPNFSWISMTAEENLNKNDSVTGIFEKIFMGIHDVLMWFTVQL